MAKEKESKKTMTLEYLNEKARYLYVVIRYYDEPKENLISFYNEAKESLNENKDFVPPMLNKEHKLLLLLIDLLFERCHQEIVISREERLDFLNGEIGLLQIFDFYKKHGLLFLIVPVTGPFIDSRRRQKTDPVIVPQRLGVASAKPGESLDCDHISTSSPGRYHCS